MSTNPQELKAIEKRIFQLIADGKTTKEIGAMLKKSPRTIQNYKQDVFLKLEVSNAAEAVSACLRANVIH